MQAGCSLQSELGRLLWGFLRLAASLPFVFALVVRSDFSLHVLHRKEVIQPHLPIRLPCYDFTPIIGPTLDGWLLERLPHRLRVLPTFVV